VNARPAHEQTWLVTGSASGIGRATAVAAAATGVTVVAADRSPRQLDELAGDLGSGRHGVVIADLANAGDCDLAFSAAADRGDGTVDVVVNAAGILERSSALDHTLESWQRTLDVNLRAPFRLIRAIARNARERPGVGRAVVNVCSYESARGASGHVAYTASKGALASLTRAAAFELGPLGIRVNGVLPGVIETPMNADLRADEQAASTLRARHRLGRFGQADEVAAVIVFLASAAASFVTGSLVAVDGGRGTH
jgi:NAD(P)-dependent dehydrogenase (short-subunit alcohol dehydrogenase family)